MTGFRKNVKLIANRSRQRVVRSSAGIGSTPYSSTAGNAYPRLCRAKKSITTRRCSSVLSKIVEWFEPRIDVLLGVRDPLVDRLLAGAVRPLVPRGHQVLVAAQHERRRGDLRQPARDVHVAHRLARGGEHLDPVRVAQDLLDRVDRGDAVGRLQERLRERLPRDQLGEDPAPRPVRVHPGDVDPVLEDQPAGSCPASRPRS